MSVRIVTDINDPALRALRAAPLSDWRIENCDICGIAALRHKDAPKCRGCLNHRNDNREAAE